VAAEILEDVRQRAAAGSPAAAQLAQLAKGVARQ
jgi:hypothetical protein